MKKSKHLKINLQLFAEGGEDQDQSFEFESENIDLNNLDQEEGHQEEGQEDHQEEYEEYEEDQQEDNHTNNDYIDQDHLEDPQEKGAAGTKANPPSFKPYQNNGYGNGNNQNVMTEQKAKEIFEEESELDPVMAWQNYTQNMVQANTQKFDHILKKEQFNNELGQLTSRYQDFQNYDTQGIVQQVDQDYTGQNRLPDMAAYEMAYLRSKIQELESQSRSAFSNGKKAGSQRRAAKKSIYNEKSGAKQQGNEDLLPDGINIVSQGDGIFI